MAEQPSLSSSLSESSLPPAVPSTTRCVILDTSNNDAAIIDSGRSGDGEPEGDLFYVKLTTGDASLRDRS